MKKRDPATAPAVGDRVPYVIIKARRGVEGLGCWGQGHGGTPRLAVRQAMCRLVWNRLPTQPCTSRLPSSHPPSPQPLLPSTPPHPTPVQAAKGAKAYEKAEDPIYALRNNLPIDCQVGAGWLLGAGWAYRGGLCCSKVALAAVGLQ